MRLGWSFLLAGACFDERLRERLEARDAELAAKREELTACQTEAREAERNVADLTRQVSFLESEAKREAERVARLCARVSPAPTPPAPAPPTPSADAVLTAKAAFSVASEPPTSFASAHHEVRWALLTAGEELIPTADRNLLFSRVRARLSNPAALWSTWVALRPTIVQGIRTSAKPETIEALRKEIAWNATLFRAPIPPELRTAARLESSQHASASRWCEGQPYELCYDPCADIEAETRLKPAREYLRSMAQNTPFDPSVAVTVTVDGKPQVTYPYSDALDILQFRLRREKDGGSALVATYLRILEDLHAALAPPPPPAPAPAP